MARRIQWHEMPQIITISNVNETLVRNELNTFLAAHPHILPWQCQLNVTPEQAYTDDEPVWVSDEEGGIHPITAYSLMINRLSDQSEKVEFLMIDKMIIDDPDIQVFIKKMRSFGEMHSKQIFISEKQATTDDLING
jgi:hypothetical protein